MKRTGYRWAKIRGAYRLSRGRRLCPRRRAVDRAMLRLDFLRLYATEDVMLKSLWPAEELCFGSAHLHARIEFEGNHVQCADEICKLEKSVNKAAEIASRHFHGDLPPHPGGSGLSTLANAYNTKSSFRAQGGGWRLFTLSNLLQFCRNFVGDL